MFIITFSEVKALWWDKNMHIDRYVKALMLLAWHLDLKSLSNVPLRNAAWSEPRKIGRLKKLRDRMYNCVTFLASLCIVAV